MDPRDLEIVADLKRGMGFTMYIVAKKAALPNVCVPNMTYAPSDSSVNDLRAAPGVID